jgi:hypothetical protein
MADPRALIGVPPPEHDVDAAGILRRRRAQAVEPANKPIGDPPCPWISNRFSGMDGPDNRGQDAGKERDGDDLSADGQRPVATGLSLEVLASPRFRRRVRFLKFPADQHQSDANRGRQDAGDENDPEHGRKLRPTG